MAETQTNEGTPDTAVPALGKETAKCRAAPRAVCDRDSLHGLRKEAPKSVRGVSSSRTADSAFKRAFAAAEEQQPVLGLWPALSFAALGALFRRHSLHGLRSRRRVAWVRGPGQAAEACTFGRLASAAIVH